MAYLISSATGNFTAAGSWSLVDSTSLLDSEAAGNVLTTSYVTSSTFTPGAITIDGIAVKLTSVSSSPSGTISVALDQGGATVAGTEVTINITDLPTMASGATSNEGGWVLFKFAAPVALLAATAYGVKAKTSGTTQANLFSSATTNWSRLLRTTTNQAPAAGDIMVVIGEHTGAGTGNSFTITMDETATTDYGPGTDGAPCIAVGKRGTLTYGSTAATNYYLKMSGDFIGYNGGTLNIGTTGTPIPRDSTAVFEFDPVADGGMGLIARNGFNLNIQGLSRTSGKNVVLCKLNTDEAVAATVLGVDTDTGWLNGDEIVIAKTNRSASSLTEKKTLSGAATATEVTISSGLTTARSGTSPTQAHVGLLTRNVMIRSASSTVMAYVNVKATATADIDWASFRYIGENATGKRGIEVETTTGSFSMQYCSVYETEDYGFITLGSATNNITVDDNIFYSLNTVATNGLYCFQIAATSGTNINIRRNFFSNCRIAGTSNAVVNLLDIGINFSNNVINDTVSGASLFMNQTNGTIGTIDNNESYCSGSGSGWQFQSNGASGTINGLKVWFNQGEGVNFNASVVDLTINDMETFGNTNRNIFLNNNGNLTFNRLISNSYSSAATASAVAFNGGTISSNLIFRDCDFSQVSGSKTAHTQELLMATNVVADILVDDCLIGAATDVSSTSSMSGGSVVAFNKHNQTANKHIWYTKYGTGRSTGAGLADTNVRTASSLALRIAPTDATTGFTWEFKILAKANTAVGITGFIQKNAAFGTDDVVVDLFLPGSTVADDTQTMPDDTSWNVFNLAANYTGGVDLYATVRITAKTTTASAYMYLDDLFNGTNKITAIDVWDKGQPSPIMFEQLGDAAAVWAVSTSTFTTTGTVGYLMTKLLTVAKFLGLK